MRYIIPIIHKITTKIRKPLYEKIDNQFLRLSVIKICRSDLLDGVSGKLKVV